MRKKTLVSWSSGKDSAWALHVLRQAPNVEVVGLFCTINQVFERVAMHGVRVALLQAQARCVGLPLQILEIPHPCSNEEYARIMAGFIAEATAQGIECFAFGDLFLDDVRQYREERMRGSGITPIFPLWGIPTNQLSRDMVAGGLRAVLTCVDPKKVPADFAGRVYDDALLDDMPAGVDPCGEYGEFHSFAFEGPMFRTPVALTIGETVQRDGYVFTDLVGGELAPSQR